PLPEWGAMISSGRRYMLESWWLVAAPGATIMLVSLAFNLLGDGLRDVLDPVTDKAYGGGFTGRVQSCGQGHSGRPRCVVRAGPRETGDCRRVRLGQVHRWPQPAASAPGNGEGHRKNPAFWRYQPARLQRKTDAGHSRPAHVDDHAGPEILAEPGDQGRRTDCRGLSGASQGLEKRSPRTHAGHARQGAHSRTGAGLRAVPPRGVRWHGPADHDRNDGHHRPAGDHRRRADVGTGCIGAASSAQRAGRTGQRARSGADFHQSRPEHGAAFLRPGAGDVCRAGGGIAERQRTGSGAPSVHPGPARRPAQPRPS
ncbi:dipeptide ABC transporter, permease protein DppC, partial [Pseudomonas syringae pv. actinidiae ICMP 19079]